MTEFKPEPYEQERRIREYLESQGIGAEGVNVIDDGQGGKVCHIDEVTWRLIRAKLTELAGN